MKSSNISFDITLDDKNVPEKIEWTATETGNKKAPADALAVALWNGQEKATLKIDLWTKEMPVNEMKQFCVETVGGIAESIKSATGDEYMFQQLDEVCQRLIKHITEENKEQ